MYLVCRMEERGTVGRAVSERFNMESEQIVSSFGANDRMLSSTSELFSFYSAMLERKKTHDKRGAR